MRTRESKLEEWFEFQDFELAFVRETGRELVSAPCYVGVVRLPCSYDTLLISQSGEAPAGQSISQTEDQAKHQTMAYNDSMTGYDVNVESGMDSTMMSGRGPDAELGSFLSRPVEIGRFSWSPSIVLFETIRPWQRFFNNPAVFRKVANYELMRCDLKVKVMINGTPFHHGRAMMGYNPLPDEDKLVTLRLGFDADLVQLSQKPHIFLNPTNNQGGEMTLPLFWPENFVSMISDDYAKIGELGLTQMGPLRHVNGADNPITITVLAWAENVILTMPTQASLEPQGGEDPPERRSSNADGVRRKGKGAPGFRSSTKDEYGKGLISKPASAVAKAMGALESFPMVAPYARATGIVATAVGEFAKVMGYSRTPILSDIQFYRPAILGNLANLDASEALQRLTLDSKQEITIDPRTTGLGPEDQMTINSIVTRESYLTNAAWVITYPPGRLLWNARVTPMMMNLSVANEYRMTPAALMTSLFEYWHGTMIYRFQIVCSSFHKGRIAVRYDPNGNPLDNEFNTGYTRIVDISEETDFEIEVGWGQARPFLPNTGPGTYYDTVNTYNYNNDYNGVIELRVLNQLSAPTDILDDTSIRINVFVRMGDDAKFGAPFVNEINDFHLDEQSGVVTDRLDGIAESVEVMSDLLVEAQARDVEDIFYFLSACRAVELTQDQVEQLLNLLFPLPALEVVSELLLETLDSQSGEQLLNDTTGDSAPVGAPSLEPIGRSAPPADHTMEVFFGECPHSLRDLMKRYILTRAETKNYAPNGMIQINHPSFPPNSGYLSDGTSSLGPGFANVYNKTVINWFQSCYAGWRGSLRAKFSTSGPTRAGMSYVYRGGRSVTFPSLAFIANLGLTDSQYNNRETMFFRNGWNGASGVPTEQCQVIEVEAPYYDNVRFSNGRFKNNGDNLCEALYLRERVFDAPNGGLRTRTYHIWQAAGEDFTFFFFTGVPRMFQYSLVGVL